MTEQEFKRQVWRAYDTVEIEGVAKNARVINVGFPSLSVRAAIAPGVTEWFKCDQIVSHKSATGEPDDLAIIADLHNKLMAANKRNAYKVLYYIKSHRDQLNEHFVGTYQVLMRQLTEEVQRVASKLRNKESFLTLLLTNIFKNLHFLKMS